MIAYLEGEIISVLDDSLIINVGGVGYGVNMAGPSLELINAGETAKLFISESISPYDGTVLYGFLSAQELSVFKLFKTNIPNTGAKKALEFLGKALRSLPDFKKAIIDKDSKILMGVFGFTNKTATKLINALKDKIEQTQISGDSKFKQTGAMQPALTQVYQALVSLGFTQAQAKRAISVLGEDVPDPKVRVEDLIKKALKVISK